MARTWVALLRGINVGGNKRVAMADLRALLESLGYGDVRTLLQSGNAVFTAGTGTASTIERKIESQIASDLGLDVKVLVRTAAELAAVVKANPLLGPKVDVKELHVAFLSSAPPDKKLAAIDRESVSPDRFEVGKGVLYLRLPNGTMGSKLPKWEKALGVTVTQRNWNTVTKLHTLASA
jgi:uncharacterized protein (DUF1697 family)